MVGSVDGMNADSEIDMLLWLSPLQVMMDKIVSYLDVLQHDCNPLSLNCTLIGVLKKFNQIIFTGVLETHCCSL